MSTKIQNWKLPWWEQPNGEERLNAESARFAQSKSKWTLLHDPRNEIEVADERYRDFCWWGLKNPKDCFIWRGEIKVSYAKPGEKLQTILWTIDFIYPPAYPFDRILVRAISPPLEPTRHVYGTTRDLLCYMPFSPNAWTTGTTNMEVLERVRNWLRGYLSRWQYGEQIELPEPLSHVIYSGQDIYLLDHLYQETEEPGYGTLSLRTKSSERFLTGGVAISHTLRDIANNREWISESPDAKGILEIVLLDGQDPRAFDIAWLDLKEELPFITSSHELLDAIEQSWPRNDFRFQVWWSNVLRSARHVNRPVWLLVRFPTPRGNPEWVGYLIYPCQQFHPDCAWISVVEQSNLVGLKQFPKHWQKLFREQTFFRSGSLRSLRLLPARQRDFFRRSQGLPYEASQLHEKRVAIIGCGALGSPAFALLARSGVGHFTLADGDGLMHWNVMRHELNLQSVRKSKTEGLWHLVAHLNPYASVRRLGYLYDSQAIAEAIEDADVVLVAVADDALEEKINQVALALGIPTIYARGLANMEVGRIHRVLPGQDACFVCLHAHSQGHGTPQSDVWLEVEGGKKELIYDEGCGAAAVPGASVDTQAIGNLLARRALDVLLEHHSPENHWVLINRAQTHARDARLWQEGATQSLLLEPVEGCPHCDSLQNQALSKGLISHTENLESQFAKDGKTFDRVEIYADAFDQIRNESAFYGRLETGGVLMGYMDEEHRTLVITYATDAGPHAKHGRSTFAKDIGYCQSQVNAWVARSNGREDYVGEWHRHPCMSTALSPTDRKSLTGIASSPAYHVTQPIMLIFGLPDHQETKNFSVSAHSFVVGHTQITTLPYSII